MFQRSIISRKRPSPPLPSLRSAFLSALEILRTSLLALKYHHLPSLPPLHPTDTPHSRPLPPHLLISHSSSIHLPTHLRPRTNPRPTPKPCPNRLHTIRYHPGPTASLRPPPSTHRYLNIRRRLLRRSRRSLHSAGADGQANSGRRETLGKAHSRRCHPRTNRGLL